MSSLVDIYGLLEGLPLEDFAYLTFDLNPRADYKEVFYENEMPKVNVLKEVIINLIISLLYPISPYL